MPAPTPPPTAADRATVRLRDGAGGADETAFVDAPPRFSPDAVPADAPPGTAVGSRLGDYVLERELGRGAMGVVFAAVHVRHGTPVALKTLPSVDGSTLHRFKQEFRAASELNHPHLVGLQELACDGGQWFFTMDRVAGVDFLTHVRPDGQASPARLKAALAQLAGAVEALHAGGIIHRDLKPTNVLVEPPTADQPDGRVVVLDFGLALAVPHDSPGSPPASRTRPAGRGVAGRGGRVLASLAGEDSVRPGNGEAGETVVFDGDPPGDAPGHSDADGDATGGPAAVTGRVGRGTVRATAAGGSPGYMAPEQMETARTGAAADWYAVGVMLYEALTGRLPFTGTARQILRNKRIRPAPRIGPVRPELTDVALVCRRLMSRRAADRAGAAEVFAAAGAAGGANPAGTAGDPAEEVLTGRESETAGLDAAARAFVAGSAAATVFVSGRSGEGKTVLARRLLGNLRGRGVPVLAGRCYDRESVPFKALDAVVDALAVHLLGSGDRAAAAVLPEDGAVLAGLFPVLGRVPAVARLPRAVLAATEAGAARRRAAAVLREVLRRVAGDGGVVCFVDDLQWGDADSASLLADVLAGPHAPKVLLVGTWRSEEAAGSGFLRAWGDGPAGVPRHDCRVGPLSVGQAEGLVVAVCGADTPAVRQRARVMAAETGGNPFLLTELARALDPARPSGAAAGLDAVIARRLKHLPPDARGLLSAVAVAGQALPLAEAAATAGLPAVPLPTIARMRTERLVRLVDGRAAGAHSPAAAGPDADGNSPAARPTAEHADAAASLDTYHDRIRETVLARLSGRERRGLHVRLAELIERADPHPAPPDHDHDHERAGGAAVDRTVVGGVDLTAAARHPRVYDLAYHFHAGRDPRAFPYQFAAGEAALAAYALSDAVGFLRRAEAVMPDAVDPAVRFRLHERLGAACSRDARMTAAADAYRAALGCADGPEQRAAAHEGIGRVLHRTNALVGAVDEFDRALRELGYPRPRTVLGTLARSAGWYLTGQSRRLTPPAPDAAGRRRAAEASVIFWQTVEATSVRDAWAPFARGNTGALHAAMRSGRPDLQARAHALIADVLAFFGLAAPAASHVRRAERLAGGADEETRAVVAGLRGCVRCSAGDYGAAAADLTASLAALERTGDGWLTSWILHNLRHLHGYRGHSAEELAAADREIRIARAASNPEESAWGHFGRALALARTGRTAGALGEARLAADFYEGTDDDRACRKILAQHLGFALMQASRHGEAAAALDRSRREMHRTWIYFEFSIWSFPQLAEALLGPRWHEPGSTAAVRRAGRAVRAARFHAARFPTIRPLTLRSRGRLAAAGGRRTRAAALFRAAAEQARTMGAEYDRARALLDLAAVTAGPPADTARADAIALLHARGNVIPRAEAWQLADAAGADACVAP